MSDKEISTIAQLVIKSIYQLGTVLLIKVYHHVSAKNNVHSAFKGHRFPHQIEVLEINLVSQFRNNTVIATLVLPRSKYLPIYSAGRAWTSASE